MRGTREDRAAVLRILRGLRPAVADDILPDLLLDVEDNVAGARAYAAQPDPHRALRQQDRDALGSKAAVAKAARRLSDALREYPTQYAVPLLAALNGAGLRVRLTAHDDEERPYPERMADALREFCDSVGQGAILAQTGPMEHRVRVGPLAYGKPLDKVGNSLKAPTMLALCVADLFARATSGDPTLYPIRNVGEPPRLDAGRPNWEAVCEIVALALPDATPMMADDMRHACWAVLNGAEGLTIEGWDGV